MIPSVRALGLALVCSVTALPAADLSWNSLEALAAGAPLAQAKALEAEAAQRRTGLLGRTLQPQLSAGAFGQSVSTGQASATWPELRVGLGWNLWNGGRDRAASKSADAHAMVATHEAALAKAGALRSLRRAYLGVLLSSAKLKALAEAQSQTRENQAKAEKKALAGLTSRTDVREFELRALTLEREWALLEDALDTEKSALAVLGGIAVVNEIQPLEGWPAAGLTSEGQGLEQKLQEARVEAALLQADAQGCWPWPSLGLELGLLQGGIQGGLQQSEAHALAGLSVSLWDRGMGATERQSLLKEAEALQVLARAAVTLQKSAQAQARRRLDRWTVLRKSLEDRAELALQRRQGFSK